MYIGQYVLPTEPCDLIPNDVYFQPEIVRLLSGFHHVGLGYQWGGHLSNS